MAFIAAKCTECGAGIEVDDDKDAGICRYCGTAFVTQKVINNYNTYTTNHIVMDAQTQATLMHSLPSLSAMRERCEKLLAMGEFDESFSVANEIIQKWPESFAGYLSAIKSFEEYHTFGTPEYADAVMRRMAQSTFNIQLGYNAVLNIRHPMEEYY